MQSFEFGSLRDRIEAGLSGGGAPHSALMDLSVPPSPDPSARPSSRVRPQALGWRLVGAGLVVGALAPLHRLLDPARTGAAGTATRQLMDAVLGQSWTGTLVVLTTAALLVVLVRLRRAREGGLAAPDDGWQAATWRGLAGVSDRAWALGCALAAGGATAAVGRLLLQGRATLADELIQLRHARLLATGRIAEAWPFDPAFRNSVNGLWTSEGWASVYPPGHTALLALAARVGAEAWLGPLATALTVGLTAAITLRLLSDRPTTARIASVAVASSPFLWGLGAGYLSHSTAALAVALALWSGLHARDGHPGWALITGLAAGLAVTARPLTGLALAVLLPVGFWVARAWTRHDHAPPLRLYDDAMPAAPPRFGVASVAQRVGLATCTGLPAALALAAWNHRLFGSWWRSGYDAAFGAAHAPGFHIDPWGNLYTPLAAVGYSGADLGLLGVRLFETPVSAVAVVGLWLLLRGRPFRGAGPFLAWALTAVVANAFYWHHGVHFGPRMLYESASAWAVLTALALVGLGLPRGTLGPRSDHDPPTYATRLGAVGVAVARAATVLCVGWAAAIGVPQRLGEWARPPEAPLPLPPGTPALVFVHGSWAGRVAARLDAGGMRRDSIETALRRNDLCRVQEYTRARRDGAPLPRLSLEALSGAPESLVWIDLSPGNRARVDPTRPLTAECTREAASDREGTLELASILARVQPWTAADAVIWVRDLGPEDNAVLLQELPARSAWVWRAGTDFVVPYTEGMETLWSEVER